MDFSELALKVNAFIETHGGYWEPAWMLAALTEEVGELSKALQVLYDIREKNNSTRSTEAFSNVEEECGDVLFALLCLTNSLDINLERMLLNTLKKYKHR